ncbi:MAG: RDD family protein, partial [Candidatus Zixiibacteriota bacterium]
YQIGAFWDRFVALLVDYGPLILWGGLTRAGELQEIIGVIVGIWMIINFVLIPLAYNGMTIGKKILGLRVIPYSSFVAGVGFELGLARFVIREIIKFFLMPWLGLINLIVLLLSRHRRGMHDFIIGSIVVSTKSGPLTARDYSQIQPEEQEIERIKLEYNKLAPKSQVAFYQVYQNLRKVGDGLVRYIRRLLEGKGKEESGFKCTECGNNLRKGESYCSSCGCKINWGHYQDD